MKESTLIHFIRQSTNRKTGPIPTTYSERKTCPPSCGLYRSGGCYAEDYYTSLNWNKVPQRGVDIDTLAQYIESIPMGGLWRHNIAGDLPGDGERIDTLALGKIVAANQGKRGFTYTHKKSKSAIRAVQWANKHGFTINLSADNVSEADQLAAHGVPIVVVVPMDSPAAFNTPGGNPVRICPAQLHDDVTCASCGVCQIRDRKHIVGFLAHGTRARKADAKARIPMVAA